MIPVKLDHIEVQVTATDDQSISLSVCVRVAVGNPALGAHAQIFLSSYTYSLSRAFDKETQGHAYSLRIHYRL